MVFSEVVVSVIVVRDRVSSIVTTGDRLAGRGMSRQPDQELHLSITFHLLLCDCERQQRDRASRCCS